MPYSNLTISTHGGAIRPKGSFLDLEGDHVRRYLWVSDFCKDKDVIDIGCGYGYGSFYLADGIARNVLAIDSDKSAIAFAYKNYQRENVLFKTIDVGALGVDRRFDIAISFEVIEHLSDVSKYFAFIEGALVPQGEFILSSPNRLYTEQFYINGKSPNRFHIHEYYPEELHRVLSQHFEILGIFVECSTSNYDQDVLEFSRRVVGYHVPAVAKRVVPQSMKNLFFKMTGNKGPASIRGKYVDFRIDKVSSTSDIDRTKPVQIFRLRK